MGLLTISGRLLLGCFFIYSAWLIGEEFKADADSLGKEFATKIAGLLNFIQPYARYFVGLFAFLKAIGGFLLILDVQISVLVLGIYLLMEIPIFCGFYHYKVGEPMFIVLFQDFIQNVSFLGALMFFLEMRYEVSVMQQKKKAPKSKRLRSKKD